MALSKEKFQQLRDEGFSVEQIAKFEKRRSPGVIEKSPGVLQSLIGKAKRAEPAIGQFVGGMGGAVLGGMAGQPAAGGIVGGTLGRAAVDTRKSISRELKENPKETMKKLILNSALHGPAGIIQSLPNSEKQRIGKQMLKTAGFEALGSLAGGTAIKAGKGALSALLGPRVAERGLKTGFRRMLDPKFYKDRFAKDVAFKVGRFFDKVKNATGKAVGNAVKKNSGKTIDTDGITLAGNDLLTKLKADKIEDFAIAGSTSKATMNRAKAIQEIYDSIGNKKKIGVVALWEKRKQMDKIYFAHRWTDELDTYLKGLRGAMNEPLKQVDKEIGETFGRYSFASRVEEDMGSKFKALEVDGEIFMPKAESFINTMLATNKDETVRILKQLDGYVAAPDKVVEDLMDVAVAESLDKSIELMGFVQRGIIGAAGGKRAIAGTVANLQQPAVRGAIGAVGRSVPVAATEAFKQE